MNKFIERISHLVKVICYKYSFLFHSNKYSDTSFLSAWTRKGKVLKVYVYELPKKFVVDDVYDLRIVYETFQAIQNYFTNYTKVVDPRLADYYFVPINLHKYQYKNKDPKDFLKYLKYCSGKKDHIIVSTGDFSQRDGNNHYGSAGRVKYDWLERFKLLALESTSDLIEGQDIGIIPANTLIEKPIFNKNKRIYLYSFFGELNHEFLPTDHIRNKVAKLSNHKDVFIGSKLSNNLRSVLNANYTTNNDYELVSRNSIFTLAPAGYGKWTYRFFQSIQWGSIPVLLSDTYVKPFSDSIPYDKFCVTIKESEINDIDKILRTYSDAKIKIMQRNLQLAQKYFTYDAFFKNLHKTLIAQKK